MNLMNKIFGIFVVSCFRMDVLLSFFFSKNTIKYNKIINITVCVQAGRCELFEKFWTTRSIPSGT